MIPLLTAAAFALDLIAAMVHVARLHVHAAWVARATPRSKVESTSGTDPRTPWERWADGEGRTLLRSISNDENRRP